MAIPVSGPLSISQFNTELSRASDTANSQLAGASTPQVGSLVYIAGQLGTLNQVAPFSFSDWYGYTTGGTSTTTTTTTLAPTTSTTTTTTTAAVGGIQYIASTSSTGTTMDISGLGLQEGDMVMVLSCSDGTTQNLPTGYTAGQNGTAGLPNYRWSYKFMGVTPDTEVSGLSGTSVHIAMAFRNVDTTNPLNVSSPTAASGGTGMPNPPAITTISDGCMIVAMGFLDDDVVASSVTAPTNFTLALAAEYGSGGNGATNMGAYFLQSTAGTENAGAFGGTGNDAWFATKAALNPIAPTTTTTSTTTSTTTAPPEIQFIGSSESGTTSITLPTGLQENDIVIIASMSDDTAQNLPNTSWINIQNGTANTVRYRWSYKRMGATPDTTATNLSSSSIAIAFAFRNVATVVTFDVTTPAIANNTTGMPNPPSITTVTNGAMVVAVGFLDDDLVTATAPSGFTLARTANYGSAGAGGTVMAAYLLKNPAGTEDAGAFGGGGTDSWVAGKLALRPEVPL